MNNYRVRVMVVTDAGFTEEHEVLVRTDNATRAGVIGRQRVATNRGEAYCPFMHKVLSVEEVPL